MAEAKQSSLNLTALVSKKTRRAKARLLQNLGKTDKTTDEIFEVYQTNFNKQQTVSQNLQKNLKHYFHCLKELHDASKNLSKSILELYEKSWPKHEIIENNAFDLDHINEDLEEKIEESVLVPLEQYLIQFSDVREKIAKRGRKLVDFDSERHAFESLQTTVNHSAKPFDQLKMGKCRDQMIEAQRVYETLNNELHDELPALYENRVPLIITILQRLFASKLTYYNENVNLCKSYLDTVETLARATEKGSLSELEQRVDMERRLVGGGRPASSTASSSPLSASQASAAGVGAAPMTGKSNTSSNEASQNHNEQQSSKSFSNAKDSDAASARTPGTFLHKVRATYKYMAEDEDELNLEAGDVIQVVEYDDPQEQEDGWLVGIKENGEKGLFPANFTKPISQKGAP